MAYEWKPGQMCKTYGGRRCRIIGERQDGSLAWEVETEFGWAVYLQPCHRDDSPKPPMRKVAGRAHYSESTGVLREFRLFDDMMNLPTVPIQWTIGEDGQPIHAVRLNEFGNPMFRVEEVE